MTEPARVGPSVVSFYPFFVTPFLGEGSPTKIDCRKKGYPYSNLSTAGPSRAVNLLVPRLDFQGNPHLHSLSRTEHDDICWPGESLIF